MEFAAHITSREDLEAALGQATIEEASANETLEIAASYGDPAQVGEAYNEVERLRLLRMLYEEALGEVEAQALGEEEGEAGEGAPPQQPPQQRDRNLERVPTAEFEAELARAIEASTQDMAAMSMEGRAVCHFFGKVGGCRNGSSCSYVHVERPERASAKMAGGVPRTSSSSGAGAGVGGVLERVASAQRQKAAAAAAAASAAADSDCCICLANQRSTLLLPCKHLCVCSDEACHGGLSSCPICRKPVESKIVGVFR